MARSPFQTATDREAAQGTTRSNTYVVEGGPAGTVEGTAAAVDKATINPDLSFNPLWADGDTAYPIATPTWILAYKNQTDKNKGAALKSWLTYVLGDGQDVAGDLDYAKLPDALRDKAVAQIDQLVDPA